MAFNETSFDIYLLVYKKNFLYKGTGNITLDAANQIYVADDFYLLDSFQVDMMDYFGAQAQVVDFWVDQTRIDINKWVETFTHQMIKDLLPEGRSWSSL